jgi:hypothetical protein
MTTPTTEVFTDTRFMTAKEQALVLTQWNRFLAKLQTVLALPNAPESAADFGNYPTALDKPFTKRLYHHLIQHCSFIAHYNRGGFLSHYFQYPRDTRCFLAQFDSRGNLCSIEYGGTSWIYGEYAPLNCAMVDTATPRMPALVAACEAAIRRDELAVAQATAARYGFTMTAKEDR